MDGRSGGNCEGENWGSNFWRLVGGGIGGGHVTCARGS